MAPEIIRMEKYNEKCDIWSIGVNTYLLLSGNFPFKGATRDQEIKSILGLDYQFDRIVNLMIYNHTHNTYIYIYI